MLANSILSGILLKIKRVDKRNLLSRNRIHNQRIHQRRIYNRVLFDINYDTMQWEVCQNKVPSAYDAICGKKRPAIKIIHKIIIIYKIIYRNRTFFPHGSSNDAAVQPKQVRLQQAGLVNGSLFSDQRRLLQFKPARGINKRYFLFS